MKNDFSIKGLCLSSVVGDREPEFKSRLCDISSVETGRGVESWGAFEWF